jgi:hypothetical protein
MPLNISGSLITSNDIKLLGTTNIIQRGLVLHLDASTTGSYPGSGNIWYDLSGNRNNVTLFNSPSFSNDVILFNGINAYARTTSFLNLSSTNQLTIEVVFKLPTVTTNVMIFEHTADWNSNSGAFGAFANSQGGGASSPVTDNWIHTNSASNRIDFKFSNLTNFTHSTFIYRSSALTHAYENANLITNVTNTSTPVSISSYANNFFYIGSRGGTGAFGQMELSTMKIYNRALSATEISQNYNIQKGRYGI